MIPRCAFWPQQFCDQTWYLLKRICVIQDIFVNPNIFFFKNKFFLLGYDYFNLCLWFWFSKNQYDKVNFMTVLWWWLRHKNKYILTCTWEEEDDVTSLMSYFRFWSILSNIETNVTLMSLVQLVAFALLNIFLRAKWVINNN